METNTAKHPSGFPWRPILAFGIFGLSVWFAAAFFRKNGVSFLSAARGHAGLLILSGLCVVATRVLDGLKLRTMAGAFSVKLSVLEWLGFGFAVPYYNTMLPKGGVLANAAYLNRRHQFSIGQFAGLASGGLLVTLFVNTLFGMGAVIWNAWRAGAVSQGILFLIFAVVLSGVVVLSRMREVEAWSGRRWLGRINRLLQGWQTLRGNRSVLRTLLGLQMLVMLIFALRYYFLFKLFSPSAAYGPVLASSALTYLSNVLIAIPANVGVRELTTSLGAQMIGEGLRVGALVSLLDRGIVTIVTLVAGSAFHLKLVQSLEKWERRAALEEGGAS